LVALLLTGCAQDHLYERGPQDPLASRADRPPYQRQIAPIYPHEDTLRLAQLGDIDTPRNYNGEAWRHTGFDIEGRAGDEVIAVAPGEACAERNPIDGLIVYLYPRPALQAKPGSEFFVEAPFRQPDGRIVQGSHLVRIGYGHLRSAAMEFGGCRFVQFGEVLGEIGSSGIASHPHLHFEIVVEKPRALPGVPQLKGAINPLIVMRRESGQPLGTVTCYEKGMTYRANPGDPPGALAIVWPTAKC
jgi:murein DD-endopeptidase MepM/ murein hydrolase activator NlpD